MCTIAVVLACADWRSRRPVRPLSCRPRDRDEDDVDVGPEDDVGPRRAFLDDLRPRFRRLERREEVRLGLVERLDERDRPPRRELPSPLDLLRRQVQTHAATRMVMKNNPDAEPVAITTNSTKSTSPNPTLAIIFFLLVGWVVDEQFWWSKF